MTTFMTRALASVAVVALATSAYASDFSYEGPTFDLASVQSEFRIGFLGDEASQDIISRNECLQDYVEADYGVPAKMFTFK
ncbi:MAG: phosphonate ABC transporter substrate-binding protein, partial [Pseudomonadota bacterium]